MISYYWYSEEYGYSANIYINIQNCGVGNNPLEVINSQNNNCISVSFYFAC